MGESKKKTVQEVRVFLDRYDIKCNDPKKIQGVIDEASKLDMNKQEDRLSLITKIALDLGVRNPQNQMALVEFLTGYKMQEKAPDKEKDVSADAVNKSDTGNELPDTPKEKIPLKDRINNLIDKSVFDTICFSGAVGWAIADWMIKDDTLGKKILKGLITGAITIPVAKVLTKGLLVLKGVRMVYRATAGTLAKAMHKKTLKEIELLTRRRDEQEEILLGAYDKRTGEVDKQAEELGLQEANFYKNLKATRLEKETNGKYKLDKIHTTKAEVCRDELGKEYGKAAKKRDDQLIIMANADAYQLLTGKLKVEPEKAVKIIRSGISIDEEGKLVVDNKYGINLDTLLPKELGVLNKAVATMALFNRVTEQAKLEFFDYVEFKDGETKYKDDVVVGDSENAINQLFEVINKQETSIPQNVWDEYTKTSKQVNFLVDCAREVVTLSGIAATREMAKKIEEKKAGLEEQKGVWKTMGEKISLAALKARARAIVESREQNMISPLIGRQSDSTRKLMQLAQEKLLPQERGAKDDQTLELGDREEEIGD